MFARMWLRTARADQLPPNQDWAIWLQMGGRGAGKTRAGAEWIRGLVNAGVRRVALVAPSLITAREVMIEGESGLLNIGYPKERPEYYSTLRRLEWPNGAIGHVFSADDPDSLRGPQFEAAWADEFCAWNYPEATMSNLRMAVRLGANPQVAVTTTPRNIPALRKLINTPGTVMTRAATAKNRHHLAAQFLTAIEAAYGGTHLARQELGGELLENMRGALWNRDMLKACRVHDVPVFDKVIVAVDPAVTHHQGSDATGIIAAGCAGQGLQAKAYILFDGTVQGKRPQDWAEKIINVCEMFEADYVVVETNQGGDLVEAVLETVDPNIIVRTVFAKKSKSRRAEPVSMLYQNGRVLHTGHYPELEDELCQLGSGQAGHSPDRADALVWAVTELLLAKNACPQITQI